MWEFKGKHPTLNGLTGSTGKRAQRANEPERETILLNRLYKYSLICFLAIIATAALADGESEPITISGKASSSEIFIGDQFTFELRVDWQKGYSVLKVEPPLELGKFEILEVKPVKQVSEKSGRFSRIYSFTLSTYDIGGFEIPPFTVTYKMPSGGEKTAQSQPIKIKVNSIPHTAADTHDIRPAKSPMDIPPKPYLRNFLIGIATVIMLLGLITYFVRRYTLAKKTRAPQEWVPPRPIEELAMEDINALEHSALLAQGKLKEFYSRASEIVRIYLGRRYRINAIDLTSFELLQALEGNGIGDLILKVLGQFFERCDLVKFAKHRPPEPEHASTLEKARLIVKETTPSPVGQPQETPPGESSSCTPAVTEIVGEEVNV